jgi:hypothetical protein
MRLVFATLLAALCACAQAQDALRGKRLYLDADRIVGSGVSCVDCHGGLPGGSFGIGRAANDPEVIERAVNTIAPMAAFRGRLQAGDYADLAAFIGNPAVPSPELRVTTTAPAGGRAAADRIDFGPVPPGGRSAVGSVQLVNLGQLPLQLEGAPRLVGSDAADFVVVGTDCQAPAPLHPQQACRIDLAFTPLAGDGTRSAAVLVDHDWVEGRAALALIGTALAAATSPSTPAASPPGAGGAGALGVGAALALLLLAALGRRSSGIPTARADRTPRAGCRRQGYRRPHLVGSRHAPSLGSGQRAPAQATTVRADVHADGEVTYAGADASQSRAACIEGNTRTGKTGTPTLQ